MKKLTFISAIILGILFAVNTSSFAQSESGDIEAGVGLAYGGEADNLGISVDGYYTINEQFRAGAAITYFLPDDDINAFAIDLNGNYIFHDEDQLMAYAIAGINIFSYNNDSNIQDRDNTGSELGLNLGAGVEYALNFGNLFGELKFAGIGGDAGQLIINAGVRFPIK